MAETEIYEPSDAEIAAFFEEAGDLTGPGDVLGDAVLVGVYEDGSEDWHRARAAGIGGSEIASILGVKGAFKSKYMLWMEKAGIIPREQSDNPLFEWGHRLEPVIREKFAEAHPEYQVLEGGSWRNRDRPYQLANPDGRLVNLATGEQEILEIKTSVTGVGWGPGPNDIPAKYVAQVRWYLDTFGFDSAWIVVLIGLGDYREYRIHADPEATATMRQAAAEFAWSLEAGVAPPIDGGNDTYLYLRERNLSIVAKGEGSVVQVDDDLAALLAAARDGLAEAETELLRIKGHLLAHMGTAKVAEHNGKAVAMRQAKGEGSVPYIVLK